MDKPFDKIVDSIGEVMRKVDIEGKSFEFTSFARFAYELLYGNDERIVFLGDWFFSPVRITFTNPEDTKEFNSHFSEGTWMPKQGCFIYGRAMTDPRFTDPRKASNE